MRDVRLLFLLLIGIVGSCRGAVKLRVGVIGGGLGGASVSYFLKEYFGDSVDITLFEGKSIGGRLATVKSDDSEYEIGGAIIHPLNLYVLKLAQLLDLEVLSQHGDKVYGFYKNGELVHSGSKFFVIDTLKKIWRYGITNLYKMSQALESILNNFLSIYDLQDKGIPFVTVNEMLKAMNPEFLNYINVSTADGFNSMGVSDLLINEIIQACLRVNYGHSVSAPMFVGAVSLAGGDANLFIKGGNKLLVDNLIKASKLRVIHEEVEHVEYNKTSTECRVSTSKTNMFFDVTIIAAPMTSDQKMKLTINEKSQYYNLTGEYRNIVCTIIKGSINQTSFDKNLDFIISLDQNDFFNSVSQLDPVDGNSTSNGKIWKVFSSAPLTPEELNFIFVNHNVIKEAIWLAYPNYKLGRGDDSFVLDERVYYINAVEWSASAMEMILIGAKNVALLIKEKHGNVNLDINTESIREREEL